MNPQSNAYKLLSILQSHAPTGSAQQECAELVSDMELAGDGAKDIELALAQCLVDGLKYENWLWNASYVYEMSCGHEWSSSFRRTEGVTVRCGTHGRVRLIFGDFLVNEEEGVVK